MADCDDGSRTVLAAGPAPAIGSATLLDQSSSKPPGWGLAGFWRRGPRDVWLVTRQRSAAQEGGCRWLAWVPVWGSD